MPNTVKKVRKSAAPFYGAAAAWVVYALAFDLYRWNHFVFAALLSAGVGGVIAQDFARIFFRNCINVGFPVVTFDGTDELNQGDEIVVDLLSGRIENITTGKVYFGSRLPQHVLSIVEDGGLKNHLKKTLKKG